MLYIKIQQQHETYEYIPFLEVPQQLCSNPQNKDTQMLHAVYCYCWQDKGGRSHLMLGTSQGHNLHKREEERGKQVRESRTD